MTPNRRIITSAAHFLGKGRKALPNDNGQCLALVRIVLEHAFDLEPWDFYRYFVTEWVQPDGYNRKLGHWARDAERSLRTLGMAVGTSVEHAEPGDLLFKHDTAFSTKWRAHVGHVAILLPLGLVMENVSPTYRPSSYTLGPTVLTPVHAFAATTTVVRFDPSKRAA